MDDDIKNIVLKNSALVIQRAYLDWQARETDDMPAPYELGMDFGQYAAACLAHARMEISEEVTAAQARHPSAGGVQPLDVEVPGAVLEALSEAQAADEARSGVHDVQRGKPNRRG